MRSIPAMRDVSMRRRAMKSHLRALGATEIAVLLADLIPLAAAGQRRARETVVSFGLALIDLREECARSIRNVREAANREGFELVASLLADPPARKQLARGGRIHEVCQPVPLAIPASRQTRVIQYEPPWILPLTEDELATMPAADLLRMAEATTDVPADQEWLRVGSYASPTRFLFRKVIQRLLWHHDASVIRQLVATRWIEERDVLIIATRRPTTHAIVMALVGSDAWIRRSSVRRAIAENPFSPPSIVLPLLPAAQHRTLQLLGGHATAGAHVAEVARALLACRRS